MEIINLYIKLNTPNKLIRRFSHGKNKTISKSKSKQQMLGNYLAVHIRQKELIDAKVMKSTFKSMKPT